MKRLLTLVALGLLVAALGAVDTQAAEPRQAQGSISSAQLAELGLGGMQPLSDQQASQVRGKFIFIKGPFVVFNTTQYAKTINNYVFIFQF